MNAITTLNCCISDPLIKSRRIQLNASFLFQIFKELALLGERSRTKEVVLNIFRTASLNGGSGWSRTIDPRLIKTVL